MQRKTQIDQLRGFSCVLMAIFHYCYHLSTFGFKEINLHSLQFTIFRWIIVGIFLGLVGYNSYYPYGRSFLKTVKRSLKIGIAAILISISTSIFIPDAWVYFGILHFISLAILFIFPFKNSPNISLVLGILIILSYAIVFFTYDSNCIRLASYIKLYCLFSPLYERSILPRMTIDYSELFPCLGITLLGIYCASKGLLERKILKNLSDIKIVKLLEFFGIHSLAFYLLHTFIVYPLAYLTALAFHL